MSFEGPKQSSGEIRTSYGEVEGSLGPGERMLVIHGTDFLSSQDFSCFISTCETSPMAESRDSFPIFHINKSKT